MLAPLLAATSLLTLAAPAASAGSPVSTAPGVPVGRQVVVPYDAPLHQAASGRSPSWTVGHRALAGGSTWLVTGSAHGGKWLQVAPVGANGRCYGGLNAPDVNVRLFVRRSRLALVTARPVLVRGAKGAELRLAAGVRLTRLKKGRYRADLPEVVVTVKLAREDVGYHSSPTSGASMDWSAGFLLREVKAGRRVKVARVAVVGHRKRAGRTMLRVEADKAKVPRVGYQWSCLAYRVRQRLPKPKPSKTSKTMVLTTIGSGVSTSHLDLGQLGRGSGSLWTVPLGSPLLFPGGARAGETTGARTWAVEAKSGLVCRSYFMAIRVKSRPLTLCVSTSHAKKLGGASHGGQPVQRTKADVRRVLKAAGPQLANCLKGATKGATSRLEVIVVKGGLKVRRVVGPHGAAPEVFQCLAKTVAGLKIAPGVYPPVASVRGVVVRVTAP